MKKMTETLKNNTWPYTLKITDLRRLVMLKPEDQADLKLYSHKYDKDHYPDRFIAQDNKSEFLKKNLFNNPSTPTIIFYQVHVSAYQNSNKSYQLAISNRNFH